MRRLRQTQQFLESRTEMEMPATLFADIDAINQISPRCKQGDAFEEIGRMHLEVWRQGMER